MAIRRCVSIVLLLTYLCSVYALPSFMSYEDDKYEALFRIYGGRKWDSVKDYLSPERGALDGDDDDGLQYRSYHVDMWNYMGVKRVKLELFDDHEIVANFVFDAHMTNMTSFFSPGKLRESSYGDIPVLKGLRWDGDEFDFDGSDDRHWTISGARTNDCRMNSGWIQVIDKPTPYRQRCVCPYENVDIDDLPAIMYAKGNAKARWADRNSFGYAKMMQLSVSRKPFPKPVPQAAAIRPMIVAPQAQPRWIWSETKK